MSSDELEPQSQEPMAVDDGPRHPEFSKFFFNADSSEEVLETVTFTWSLKSWRDLQGSLTSDVFTAGKRKWRLLLFPEGNEQSRAHECVSLFLKLLHPGDEGAEDIRDIDESTGGSESVDGSVRAAQDAKRARTTTADGDIASDLPKGVSPCENDPNYVIIEDDETNATENSEPDDGGICVRALLSAWNPEFPDAICARDVFKRYNSSVQDWGYSQFIEIRQLLKPQYEDHAIIENDAVNISIVLRVIKDETGTLWRDDLRNYNSKKATGHIGLLNQGATCYLNSLVQSLFYTKVFRQAVYNIPGSAPDSVAANLQALFYSLSTSTDPVGTSDLTRAFGWTSAESFTQHDVQELNRVLMDRLETAMKGTPLENSLSTMLVGQMKSFIKCLNVDYESSRVEDYWDIQLNVRGCMNIYESFKYYTESELLVGENQYQAGAFGLQDARKGVIFESFPPVLHLQLKRYDYDYVRDMEVKINDRYEYPLELDLKEFIDPDGEAAKDSEPWIYQLQGVLVHSGDLNAGHYYALIRPNAEGPWFRFDDDYVTRASEYEVLEANYGGESQARVGAGRGIQRISSAYMLVYVRKSRLDFVLPRGPDRVPKSIPYSLQKQRTAEIEDLEEEVKRDKHTNIRVLSTAQFTTYHGAGVAPWVEFEKTSAAPSIKSVGLDETISSFFEQLATEYDMNPREASIWSLEISDTGSNRLVSLENSLGRAIKTQVQQYDEEGPVFWLESKPRPTPESLLMFVKVYDQDTNILSGVDSMWIDADMPLSVIPSSLGHDSAVLHKETYNELKPLSGEETPSSQGLGNGSILVVELQAQATPESGSEVSALSDAESNEEVPDVGVIQTAVDYYRQMHQRINVVLSPKSAADDTAQSPASETDRESSDSLMVLHNVSTSSTYTMLSTAVGAMLDMNPDYLALYVSQWNGLVRLRSDGENIRLLLPPYAEIPETYRKLVWEQLSKPLAELEQYISLFMVSITDTCSGARQLSLDVHGDTCGYPLVCAILEAAGIDLNEIQNYKIWTSRNERLVQPLPDDLTARALSQRGDVYVGPVTTLEDEIATGKTEGILVTVFHYHYAVYQTHSFPFTFGIEQNETWKSAKERLRRQLGLSEKIFMNIPIRYFVSVEDEEGTPIVDDELICTQILLPGSSLGLDHAEKRRYRYNSSAITMK